VPIFPCPCCGYLIHDEPPGSYGICPICRWEDDLVQLRRPLYAGGANKPSLIAAQRSYATLGAKSESAGPRGREARAGESVDGGFRPVNLAVDDFEPTGIQEAPWPDDRAVLYWWRPSFWRTGGSAG
jgi:hypothetical protein